MSAIAPTGFSYAEVPADAAAVARDAASAIRNTLAQSLATIGQHLSNAKRVLPHGTFTTWAVAELGMSERSVRNYIQAAAWLADKPATVAVLPPGIVYALSAPSAPAEVVDSVVADATAGAALVPDVIQTKLDQAREREQEIRKAERRQPNLTREEVRAKVEARQHRAVARQAKLDAEAEAQRAQRQQRARLLAEKLHQVAPELTEVLRDPVLTWALRDMLVEMAEASR